MPTVYMTIGVPASGKSTLIANSAELSGLPVASSDFFIEEFARQKGLTYDDVFSEAIDKATDWMNHTITENVRMNKSFIWDQTNLTEKSRAKKLSRIPKGWKKVAIYLPMPEENEWKRRLASRPGKTIPAKILEDMKKQIQPPTLLEGFDKIITKDN